MLMVTVRMEMVEAVGPNNSRDYSDGLNHLVVFDLYMQIMKALKRDL